MKEAEEPKPLSLSWPLGIAVAVAALGTLALGLWPSPLLGMAQQAIGARRALDHLLGQNENKRPRPVFSTGEAFPLQEGYIALFSLKR
jgi:hypothetical protein